MRRGAPSTRGARRRSAALALALASCAAAPPADGPDLGLAASLLPNLGVAASASAPLQRTPDAEWRAETRFTYQFVDDKAFADNGLPEAGDWTQLELGVRVVLDPQERRIWSLRGGGVAFRARGEPNIVDESGDYAGVYLALSREVRVTRSLAIGPELVLLAASGPDDFVLVPQLVWGLRFAPGSTGKGEARR